MYNFNFYKKYDFVEYYSLYANLTDMKHLQTLYKTKQNMLVPVLEKSSYSKELVDKNVNILKTLN
ncbi:MAG: hypothetical protein GYA87_08960 [Christensenellaceae bacterium]|nr:hypothetical protein [Christensenellaceae bacterium]